MIVRFFPSGSRSGTAFYLAVTRADRAVWIVGDQESYTILLSLLDTENPYCAFVISFETAYPHEAALRIAQEFIEEILLGGAARGSIPYLLVLHDEPFGSGHRTAVHGSIINYHIGLGRTIRPYPAPRDNWWRFRWQDLKNEELGTRKPQWTKAKLRRAPLPTEPSAREMIAAAHAILREELANHPDAEAAIIAANAILRTGLPDLNGVGATIDYDEDNLTLSFLGRQWPLGKIIRPSGRTARRSGREPASGIGASIPDLGALAAARRAHFVREFGPGGHAPAPDAVAAHLDVYTPRLLRPAPPPEQAPTTTNPEPRRNEIEFGGI